MDEKYFSSTENIKTLIGGQKISELIEELILHWKILRMSL